MSYISGDPVVHKSDNKPRKMVVVGQAHKRMPPLNRLDEMANTGIVPDGYYYCTWIAGRKKGEGFFHENELAPQ